MKYYITSVRMRSGITLETHKMSKKAPCFVEFKVLTNDHRQKRFSQKERRADLQCDASDFLIFALGLSYDISKLPIGLPRYFDHESP